jgi:protein phosphatase
MMAVVSAYKSDIGRRKQNQDYIWADEEIGLFIVADGMGGQEAGEIASEMAANTIGDLIKAKSGAPKRALTPERIEALLVEAIETANEMVSKAAKAADQKREMGATIVVAWLHAAKAYISHAGDARAYHIRGGTISQLTKDDSWSTALADEGIIDQDKVQDHIYSHIVTKAVGQGSPINPSLAQVTLTPSDWLLLCSDGLWNMVSDEQILNLVRASNSSPHQAVINLVAAANEAGGKDNISITAIKMIER